jgi:hypothetical protein
LSITGLRKNSIQTVTLLTRPRLQTASRTKLAGEFWIDSKYLSTYTWDIRLEKAFKGHAARLKKTGEGVQEPYYIAPNGPDHDTDGRTKNIWEDITNRFEFFPDLWKVWCTKPNLVPVCITTGIGPNGPQTILIQKAAPPSSSASTPSSVAPETPSTPSSTDPGPLGSTQGSTQNGLQRTISDSVIDPQLLNLPSTPAPQTPVAASADKENAPPSSDRRQAPRSSSFSSLKAANKELPSVIPQKRSFEQDLVDVQRCVFSLIIYSSFLNVCLIVK